MAKAVLDLVFPGDWVEGGGGWIFTECVATLDVPDGKAALAGGVLKDGTNLLGLAYPGGQRVLRAPLGTGMEERFTGRDLGPSDEALATAWRHAVASMVRAGQEVRSDLGASS